MSTPTILLFDIDRTLIDNGGAGRRAMERGLQGVLGGPANERWLDFELGGLTDVLIVREALGRGTTSGAGSSTLQGGSAAREPVASVIEAYLSALDQELSTPEAAREYVVYPGVVPLLSRLTGLGRVAVGLGTGNVEPGARLKLRPGDLNRFFDFGGFGSDGVERSEVLAAGLERGARRLDLQLSRCRKVVIGDTPRDVAAGLAVGACCIGVATGEYSAEQLLRSGAHHAFASLGAPGVEHALLTDPGRLT